MVSQCYCVIYGSSSVRELLPFSLPNICGLLGSECAMLGICIMVIDGTR